MRFANKIVWITGGGSGLGAALALELAKQGAHIALSGRRAERLQDVAQKLQALGKDALVVPCDVTQPEQLQTAAQQIVSHFHQLDIVIANAGFAVGGRIETLQQEDWQRQFNVNVIGLAQTAQIALPYLAKTQGQVVLIGSVAAFAYAEKAAPYCASKAAVDIIGRTLSLELIGTGVSCTTIHPGYVESEIAQVDNHGVFHADAKDKRPASLMWPAEKAAQAMAHAIFKRRRVYVFTMHGKLIAWLGRHFPWLIHLCLGWKIRNRKRHIKTPFSTTVD